MKGKDNKHLIAFQASKLKPGETVQSHLEGWIGDMMGKGKDAQHNGQFILTNQRVCFYRKGVFGEVFETIPLGKLTSVECLSRMGYRVMRLHTSHDELAFKTFEAKEMFDEVYDRLEASRHGDTSTEAPQAGVSEALDIPDQLRKLAELRELGILDESEFAAKKTELLARL
ncbi:SHOCT domain-containing protein [Qipengyuania sp.]|uniref:SHOCT domain-containing protein n=1 Tax=Qipengyuania sp. TaxID=2004515 RepID=UPI003736073D